MKKFSFKFEKDLNIKEQLENQLKIEYTNINEQLLKEKEELFKIEKDFNTYSNQLSKMLNYQINLLDIKLYKNALIYIENKKTIQNEIIENTESILENIKVELIEITKEKKIYEKLKEKEYNIYMNEIEKAERQEAEEFTIFSYIKNKRDRY